MALFTLPRWSRISAAQRTVISAAMATLLAPAVRRFVDQRAYLAAVLVVVASVVTATPLAPWLGTDVLSDVNDNATGDRAALIDLYTATEGRLWKVTR